MELRIRSLAESILTLLVVLPLLVLGVKKGKLEIITQFSPPDCSVKAELGDEVAVHYTGSLEDGKVFDSSVQQNREPLNFVLGEGKVIPGWEQGIQGMCVGEKRKLIIPHELAYGDRGYPPVIPPKATLTFETELMDLQKGESSASSFVDMLPQIMQFMIIPVAAGLIVYYMYNKYKSETSTKGEKRGKKKRH